MLVARATVDTLMIYQDTCQTAACFFTDCRPMGACHYYTVLCGLVSTCKHYKTQDYIQLAELLRNSGGRQCTSSAIRE
jgi:hypothetical protein